MGQQELNNRTLIYFKQRLKEGITTIPFIQSELKRAEEEEAFDRAIAIREALKHIQRRNELN